MGNKLPQPTSVLIHRLRRVAKWLDQKAETPTTQQGQAQVRARANTCWQSAARLEELTVKEESMRQITCDECRIVKDADQWGLPPAGWFQLTRSGEGPTRDYCTISCAVNALDKWARPPVSKVEQTIEDAERAGLHPAEFI